MAKALIRVLFGEPNNRSHDYLGSRSRLDKDIRNIYNQMSNGEEFYIYAMGKYNYSYLKEIGFRNVVLASEDPYSENNFPGNYLHKLIGIKFAMQDFDEIVFLDWDTIQTKPFPTNFWEEFGKKEVIQAPLYKCPKAVCHWRTFGAGRLANIEKKRLPGGCFVYMRDKTIPDKLLEMMKLPKPPSEWADEPYFAKYMDDMIGGWQGIDKYYELFEPKWCELIHATFKEEKKDTACFYHPRKG